MINTRQPSEVKLAKDETQPSQSTPHYHGLLQMEDILELVFDCLDSPSLKQCRLTCSSWTPIATRLLMKRTFYNLSATAGNHAESFYKKTSLSSIKIHGDLLSRISSTMRLRSSVRSHWKSISISLVALADGISSLVSFLTSISCSECPQLTNLRITFENDVEYKEAVGTPESLILKFMEATQHSPGSKILLPKLNIRCLNLDFRSSRSNLEITNFLKTFLHKNVFPHLKELTIQLPVNFLSCKLTDGDPRSKMLSSIIVFIPEITEVLGSLRVLKIQRKIPTRSRLLRVPRSQEAILKLGKRLSPISEVGLRLELSSELRELQWGSEFIVLPAEDNGNLPSFLPRILTPCVASVLETLHLGGVYLCDGFPFRFPSVEFPHMPRLRKLTVEEVTVISINNFSTIFKKAQSIREFRVKNNFENLKGNVYSFTAIEELIEFEKWEATLGVGGYPSLCLLELGDSIDVTNSFSLQKLSQMFPTVEDLQFVCDDVSQRIHKKVSVYYSQFELKAFKVIEEGLKEWQSLRRLKVSFWPLLSSTGLMKHLLDCYAKLRGLRLYDFQRGDGFNQVFHMTEIPNMLYANQMTQKFTQLVWDSHRYAGMIRPTAHMPGHTCCGLQTGTNMPRHACLATVTPCVAHASPHACPVPVTPCVAHASPHACPVPVTPCVAHDSPHACPVPLTPCVAHASPHACPVPLTPCVAHASPHACLATVTSCVAHASPHACLSPKNI